MTTTTTITGYIPVAEYTRRVGGSWASFYATPERALRLHPRRFRYFLMVEAVVSPERARAFSTDKFTYLDLTGTPVRVRKVRAARP